MKISIDMENLNEIVKCGIEENIQNVISDVVKNTTKEYIDKNIKGHIEQFSNEKIDSFLKEYFSTATVTVGGGFYSGEEAKTYTIKEYVKKSLADDLKNQTMTIKEKDRYGDLKEKKVSFEEYILKNVNSESLIKPVLDKFIKETRDNINQNVKDAFDSTTKEMLSSTVLNVLMQSETYAKINNAVKGIANGKA